MVSDNRLRVKPIMLPYSHIADSYESIKLLYREQISSYEYGRDGRTTQILIGKMGYLPQHLYLVSERKIIDGDWVLYGISKRFQHKSENWLKEAFFFPEAVKIEATTDPSLGLPLIPQSFIEEWVDKQGKIENINLAVKFSKDGLGMLFVTKTDLINEVIITPVKETWSREELKRVSWLSYLEGLNKGLDMAAKHNNGGSLGPQRLLEEFNNWFNKNY